MLKKYKEIILYLFFGVCTTVINMLVYALMYEWLRVNNVISTILAWLAAVVFAFVTNKVFVFESKREGITEFLHEFTAFFGCRILTGVLDVVVMIVAVDVLGKSSLIWKFISNVIVTILNYVASKFYIFR